MERVQVLENRHLQAAGGAEQWLQGLQAYTGSAGSLCRKNLVL